MWVLAAAEKLYSDGNMIPQIAIVHNWEYKWLIEKMPTAIAARDILLQEFTMDSGVEDPMGGPPPVRWKSRHELAGRIAAVMHAQAAPHADAPREANATERQSLKSDKPWNKPPCSRCGNPAHAQGDCDKPPCDTCLLTKCVAPPWI